MNSILKNFTRQAKNLVTTKNPQVEKERNQLLTKLFSLGLLGKDANIGDILSLTLKDILERRLQTLVYRRNFAISIRQARQFIVHEHIFLGDKIITAPSYLVHSEEENSIQFAQGSAFSNANHPARAIVKREKSSEKSEEQKEKKTQLDEKTKKKETKVEEKKVIQKEETEVPNAHDLKKQKGKMEDKKPKAKKE